MDFFLESNSNGNLSKAMIFPCLTAISPALSIVKRDNLIYK